MKLKIYMKSGNVIKLDRVKDYHIKCQGNEVVYLEVKPCKWPAPRNHLLITSIDLSQIEAVTKG